MVEELKQLCESKIKNGEYDSVIAFLIGNNVTDKTILHEMMNATRGHENPNVILDRIRKIREKT